MRDDLAEQRIVVRRHARSGLDVRIDADALAGRPARVRDASGAGHEVVVRVFRIDAAFDGPARRGAAADCAQRAALARRDRDLLGDEVEAGHHLGHRMLHLDARVHLEEVELVAVDVDAGTRRCRRRGSPGARAKRTRRRMQRARAARRRAAAPGIPRSASGSGAAPSSRARRGGRTCRRRRRAPALRRAGRAPRSAPGRRARRRRPRRPRRPPCPSRRQVLQVVDALHAAPAAAAHGLDQQRRADALGQRLRLLERVHRAAGHDRHIRGLGLGARAQLVADRLDLRRGRADEHDAVLFAAAARTARARRGSRSPDAWHRSRCRQRRLHDGLDLQVGIGRPPRTDADARGRQVAPAATRDRLRTRRAPSRCPAAGSCG